MAFGTFYFGSSITTHEFLELFCTLVATVLIDRHFLLPFQFINLLSDRGFAGEAHLIVDHLSAGIEEHKGRHSLHSVGASCCSPYRR